MKTYAGYVAAVSATIVCGCQSSTADTKATNTDLHAPAVHVVVAPKGDTIPLHGQALLSASAQVTTIYQANGPMNWTAVNPTIVDLTATGNNVVVSGLQRGATIIYVTYTAPAWYDNNGHYPSVTATDSNVTVVDSLLPPSGKGTAGGSTVQLSSSYQGGGTAGSSSFTWGSTNNSIATISASGLATPLSPGTTGATISQTINGTTKLLTTGVFSVTGNGACSLNPNVLTTRNLTFKVQSDPGNHAAAINLPTTATTIGFAFGSFAGTNMQVGVSGAAPFVNVAGGWMAPTDCNFVANGMGTIGGQQNVGVRLEGVWSNGALTLKYTVGTNGELSGGATVYTVTG